MSRVLLVEDNELNRDMLSRRLARRGFDVVCASDGECGLAASQQESLDLILMDLSLPKMDGWECVRHIKQNPETANVPIIALTAHALSSDRDKAMEAGCDDYDTKPISLPRLLVKMESLLKTSDDAATEADP